MKSIESFPFKVSNGQFGTNVRFTPQNGTLIGFSIYHNNDAGNKNPGLVNASIKIDGGEDIAPQCDIRHYRNRDAAYVSGLVQLDHNTGGKTHILTITAEAAFTADFIGTLVFVYEPQQQFC
jgi:hypothetical protein